MLARHAARHGPEFFELGIGISSRGFSLGRGVSVEEVDFTMWGGFSSIRLRAPVAVLVVSFIVELLVL